jgi:hypothetical protein
VPPLDSGTVHQNSDLVSVGHDLRDEPSNVLHGAEIGGVDERFAAQLANSL